MVSSAAIYLDLVYGTLGSSFDLMRLELDDRVNDSALRILLSEKKLEVRRLRKAGDRYAALYLQNLISQTEDRLRILEDDCSRGL